MAAELQRLERFGRRIDQRRPGIPQYARQLLAQLLAKLVVEIGKRLVHKDEIDVLHDGAGDRGSLLLAARKLRGQALEERFKPQHLRGASHPRRDIGGGEPCDP